MRCTWCDDISLLTPFIEWNETSFKALLKKLCRLEFPGGGETLLLHVRTVCVCISEPNSPSRLFENISQFYPDALCFPVRSQDNTDHQDRAIVTV